MVIYLLLCLNYAIMLPQVIVLDQVTPQSVLGPTYLAVWEKVFSPVHPPALLRVLAQDAAAKARAESGGQLPPGAALCFKGEL